MDERTEDEEGRGQEEPMEDLEVTDEESDSVKGGVVKSSPTDKAEP